MTPLSERTESFSFYFLTISFRHVFSSSPTHEVEIWLSQLSMRLTWAWPSLPVLILTSHTIFLNQKGKWTYSSKRHLTLLQYSRHKTNKVCCRDKFFCMLSSIFFVYKAAALHRHEIESCWGLFFNSDPNCLLRNTEW